MTGAKLCAVPNCPWCQIVLVPNCPRTVLSRFKSFLLTRNIFCVSVIQSKKLEGLPSPGVGLLTLGQRVTRTSLCFAPNETLFYLHGVQFSGNWR